MKLVRLFGIILLGLTIALRIVQLADAVGNVSYHENDGRTVFTKFQKMDREVKTEGQVVVEMNENWDLEIHCWNGEGRRVNITIREEMDKQPRNNRLYASRYSL